MKIDRAVFLFFFISTIVSCNTIKGPLFGKRSPHEKYADAIASAGLKESILGKAWFKAANDALFHPQAISLPYKETGFFGADKPRAAGFLFKANRGENVLVTISTNPDSINIFLELWQPAEKQSLLAAMDTLTKTLKYTVKKNDSFIVRIQPELLVDLNYTIIITTGPSLAFPVDKSGNPHIISFWGNPRDNGARKHEGVDIQAKFRTPALAAANGVISRVTENNLGGKVVFLRDASTSNNLYYAHLDSQIVVEGQNVKVGDTIGLIGKTGNARNTVPHLHFGIYTFGGAIDPFPFINPDVKEPKKITTSLENIDHFLRTTSSSSLYEEPATQSRRIQTLPKNEAVFILAATSDWYKVRLPGDTIGYINSHSLTNKDLKQLTVKNTENLRVQPFVNAPVKDTIATGEKASVIGVYSNFYLVNYRGMKGWISKSE